MTMPTSKKKFVKLTTFNTIKRGNWFIRFSTTDMGSLMLLARSAISYENVFIKYFSSEEEAVSFCDFLVLHDFYNPHPETE